MNTVPPKLIIFDLDGTLTESKQNMDSRMSDTLCRLLLKAKVAVIGGGSPKQFHNQFINFLKCPPNSLPNLYIAPLSGGSLYINKNGSWENLYKEVLTPEEKEKIMAAFDTAFKETGFVPAEKIYGQLIEDREGQITFSGLGQEAPPDLKAAWDPDHQRRATLKKVLDRELPEFEIRMGGGTSIDISHRGIDKAYGVRKISDYLKIPVEDMFFIGDALYEGGNDAAVLKTGIRTRATSGPQETIRIIIEMID